MSEKLYQLFCDHCSFKKITNGINLKLIEHKTAAVQFTIPDLDPETELRKEIKFKELPKRFKCPQCGYIIKPKVIENPQYKIDEECRLKERIKKRSEYEKEQERLEKEKNENRINGDKASIK
jgi:rubredoxin